MQVHVNSLFKLRTPSKITYINAHMSHFLRKPVGGLVTHGGDSNWHAISYRDKLKSRNLGFGKYIKYVYYLGNDNKSYKKSSVVGKFTREFLYRTAPNTPTPSV